MPCQSEIYQSRHPRGCPVEVKCIRAGIHVDACLLYKSASLHLLLSYLPPAPPIAWEHGRRAAGNSAAHWFSKGLTDYNPRSATRSVAPGCRRIIILRSMVLAKKPAWGSFKAKFIAQHLLAHLHGFFREYLACASSRFPFRRSHGRERACRAGYSIVSVP